MVKLINYDKFLVLENSDSVIFTRNEIENTQNYHKTSFLVYFFN